MLVPLPPTERREKKKQEPILILVCAWCPEDQRPPRLAYQQYTHGICSGHSREMLAKVKN